MNKAFLYIIVGASFWGTISWYVKHLYEYGFTPMEVVTLRAWTAAILLVIYLLIKSPKKLKLQQTSDVKYFVGTGIFSIIFFNYCLFKTIEIATIPVATALLYTAPAIVTIASVFLFKEELTRIKGTALLATLIGTCLVVGIIPLNLEILKWSTLIFGIGSGIGYALYSIISKFALVKYESLVITTYTFVVAAIALTPFFSFADRAHLLANPTVLFYAFGLGFLPTAFAYIIYTLGLQKTEASKASILSTIEPVVATLIGIIIFKEVFTFIQFIGMFIIIGAVILMQWKGRSKQVSEKRIVNS